ncbi:MAG: hypothetical protein JO282_03040, partial [Alphaproteobacteria bacterium]|nr:hypothetical protein [Alphaproteobacteria bacterium]
MTKWRMVGCLSAAIMIAWMEAASAQTLRIGLAGAAAPNPAIEINVVNNPEALQGAQVVQAMAREAGFDIRIKAVDFISAIQAAVK